MTPAGCINSASSKSGMDSSDYAGCDDWVRAGRMVAPGGVKSVALDFPILGIPVAPWTHVHY